MPKFIALLLSAATLAAAPGIHDAFSTEQDHIGIWKPWSPRPEIAPKFVFDGSGGRIGDGALVVRTGGEHEYGAWNRTVELAGASGTYRIRAFYKTWNVENERRSVIARVHWKGKEGQDLRPPEYAIDVGREGDWKRVELITPAPANAASIDVQLSLGFAGEAQVWWDDFTVEQISESKSRVVRAATVFHRPRGTKSAAESVEQFCELALRAEKPDIICLPEGITVVGNGKSYYEVGESIPGPTTERLGKLALALRSYVVAGIYELDGKVLYNTAVLMDREGRLVGKYRKTHLPREEWEAGITPGNEYPVFDTDFGKVGLMICWDVQFPEPCRALGAKGAELVLLPIWGGNETLAKARAIENHLFLVSSSYDMKTFIVDPVGTVLAEADATRPVVTAELHLDRIIWQPWLGNMKNRTWKEWRPDIDVTTGQRRGSGPAKNVSVKR